VIDGGRVFVATACLPFSWTTIKVLPIFKPNDFFFEKHQQEGEEKDETYARVMRVIMAEAGGL